MFNPKGYAGHWRDGSSQYTKDAYSFFAARRDITEGVLQALENVPFSQGDGPFTICEYGAADGGTSMPIILLCIKKIKERFGNEQEIHVIYEDLPTNDFKSLFKRTNGLIPGAAAYSVYPHVYVSAVGTSFYSQVTPSNTVNFGFSSTALQYLSRRPGPLDDAMIHFMCPNEEQKRAFAVQAAKDWELILLNRAAELKPGCRMFFSIVCSPPAGLIAVSAQYVNKSLFKNFRECWEDFERQNKITKQELDSFQVDVYCRSEEEFRAAFRTDGPVHTAGLRLITYEEREWRCVHHSNWNAENNKGTDNRHNIGAKRAYAEAFIRDMSRWANWPMMSALDTGRSESEKKSIVDALFESYGDKVADAPEEHSYDLFNAYLVIQKL